MNYKEAEVICKGGNMPTKQLVMSAQSGAMLREIPAASGRSSSGSFHQSSTRYFNVPSRYSALTVNGAYLASRGRFPYL